MEIIGSWLESSYSRSTLCVRRRKLRLGLALQDSSRWLGLETRSPSFAEKDEARTIDNRNAQTRILVAICPRHILKRDCGLTEIIG